MDKWIELVKAKMKELHITQVVLAERLGMSQGGVGHWLTKRRQPSLEDMNRVLQELGLEFLEVAMVIREPDTSTDEGMALAQKYNPYFRYPVNDWHDIGAVREGDLVEYQPPRYELTDYHAQGDAFWLVVVGDAMTAPSGLSIPEGMSILVDPAIEAVPGKLVIAQLPGSSDATFRKLIEESGQRYLVPLNPTYPKTLYTEQCRIIGVVVQATIRF
ncbi:MULTISPECIES: LexA family protein [Pseudomonas]|jgi:SOS-response transcriptional repressor LexA|uniref:Cro/Cl family transcriptional regulator n=1 Tax=Pseudomonas frederiksbergensis TaxID=104087 RepID=A0A0B1Z9T5_9PSED|nr:MULTISPECIES: S24 family peptidase [Pseudomonas]KHK66112.1 Cro/Cl family transcriptional regulator [Pseudomonas frederiksbergensis]KJH85441.1 Cro/Cl family transcriptional regulator [Pseudomonas fluorescens]MBI6617462.1 helix-turn-helix domain-containing protein [Pseudomonas corrugata]MBI6693282.1 helix-turn-helix domain-containing protein [Pseudomonas corrugata]WRV66507.1 S24 family peptidase [Pseudomonas frederiksbergensis]